VQLNSAPVLSTDADKNQSIGIRLQCGQLALQRQLKRERVHLQWLEQHLPQSAQLSLSKERITALALQCAALSEAKQKKRCTSNAFS